MDQSVWRQPRSCSVFSTRLNIRETAFLLKLLGLGSFLDWDNRTWRPVAIWKCWTVLQARNSRIALLFISTNQTKPFFSTQRKFFGSINRKWFLAVQLFFPQRFFVVKTLHANLTEDNASVAQLIPIPHISWFTNFSLVLNATFSRTFSTVVCFDICKARKHFLNDIQVKRIISPFSEVSSCSMSRRLRYYFA